jgi:hypothetical protein
MENEESTPREKIYLKALALKVFNEGFTNAHSWMNEMNKITENMIPERTLLYLWLDNFDKEQKVKFLTNCFADLKEGLTKINDEVKKKGDSGIN